MGRGDLSRLSALVAIALVAAAPAAATSSVPFHVVARGAATAASAPAPYALLATTRTSAHRIVVRVPANAAGVALAVNYRTNLLIGVFGEFGCKDDRVQVARVDSARTRLVVRLVETKLPPGTVECQALYPTFRLLTVPRRALLRVPTAATVTVARS